MRLSADYFPRRDYNLINMVFLKLHVNIRFRSELGVSSL